MRPHEGIFVIAEIGINHNGSVGIAKQLIDVACDAGADAVKFQKRTVDIVYPKEVLDSPRESQWGSTTREQKEGLEFGLDEYTEIDAYCRKKNIEWFASAWDIESLKFLRQFGLKYNKVASAMIVDSDLLMEIALEGKHTFISTGMSTTDDIDAAVAIFQATQCSFELMHCIGNYPVLSDETNLNCIRTLRDRYGCVVGYSGHETGLAVSLAAAALGISSLERHITISRAMYGSDQAASIAPSGLRQLIGAVRKIEKAMGDGVLRMTEQESIVAKKLRVHIPQWGIK